MFAARLGLAGTVCCVCLAATSPSDYRAPSFSSEGLVNPATGQAVFAPYSICTIYGADLFLNGAAAATGRTQVPNSLGGVAVLIGSIQAGIFYISSSQINFLIPNSLTPGTYPITVVRDGFASPTVPIVIQDVAPGLFASSPGIASTTHADGSAVSADSPAIPGEVVIFYGTGFGRARPDPSDRAILSSAAPIVHSADTQILLDGMPIDPSLVEYAGITPFNAGLYQLNVRLPAGLPATNPEVQVTIAGSQSPRGLRLITGPNN